MKHNWRLIAVFRKTYTFPKRVDPLEQFSEITIDGNTFAVRLNAWYQIQRWIGPL